MAYLIGVRTEAIEEYERIHEAVWPEVLATIHACNIRNYSIFRPRSILSHDLPYAGKWKTCSSPTTSTSAMITRPTWQRWRRIR